jgi:hypothetical protein
MRSPQPTSPPDEATVDRLSPAFNRCFETLEAPEDLFAPDAFCDLLPPLWRFQLVGPRALGEQLRAWDDNLRARHAAEAPMVRS